MFEVESKYVMKEQIGQGAYGVVCSAFDLQKQSLMAVKKIENVFDHRSLAKRTLRELQIVRALKHENILGLERVMRPHSGAFSNVYLVSEVRYPSRTASSDARWPRSIPQLGCLDSHSPDAVRCPSCAPVLFCLS